MLTSSTSWTVPEGGAPIKQTLKRLQDAIPNPPPPSHCTGSASFVPPSISSNSAERLLRICMVCALPLDTYQKRCRLHVDINMRTYLQPYRDHAQIRPAFYALQSKLASHRCRRGLQLRDRSSVVTLLQIESKKLYTVLAALCFLFTQQSWEEASALTFAVFFTSISQ